MLDEDKKLILERYGFKQKRCGFKQHESYLWHTPDGFVPEDCLLGSMPDLDPNFYFKYVEPRLFGYSLMSFEPPDGGEKLHEAIVYCCPSCRGHKAYHRDPAEAFERALLELIQVGDK